VIELLAIVAGVAAVSLVFAHRPGFAFTATTVTIAACILAVFVDLYPNVMVSSTSAANSLTVHNTASDHYSLTAMTVVVVIFLPLVLLYQAWTYYVFRGRVSAANFQLPPKPRAPADADAQSPAPGTTRPASHRRTFIR
jgi:cytochrome bd ubiquinol oxidase subunit II